MIGNVANEERPQFEEGCENFRRLVANWAIDARDAGLHYPVIEAISEAAAGRDLRLTPTYLSNMTNESIRPPAPTYKRVVAISKTNKLIARLQEGKAHPGAPSEWLRLRPITVNGELADTAVLSRVISGEIIPQEAHRWEPNYETLEDKLEQGLIALFNKQGISPSDAANAYPFDDPVRRNRLAAVLIGVDRLPREELRAELSAITEVWQRLTGESIAPPTLVQRALNLA